MLKQNESRKKIDLSRIGHLLYFCNIIDTEHKNSDDCDETLLD
jgi:hypothetical protein